MDDSWTESDGLEGELESKLRETPGRGDPVRVPPAQPVVLVEHGVELGGRAVHAGGWTARDRLVHHAPGQAVVPSAHALANVDQPLEVHDALARPLQLLRAHVPAGHGPEHRGVRLADVEAESA